MQNQSPKQHKTTNSPIKHSIRNHLMGAGAAIFVLVGIGGTWSVATKISGAVIAHGTVVVDSEVKQIQHREGGIVREILVDEGQEVAAGDLLVRLDDTLVRNNYSIVQNQLAELKARQARLVAERDDQPTVTFPSREEDLDAATFADIEATQSMLLKTRKSGLAKQKGQLEEQISQLEKQISGYETRAETKQGELALIEEELADVSKLFEKNLVAKTRLTSLQRDKTRIVGEYGELNSQIASVEETISETNMRLLQVDEEYREEVLQELQDITLQISELELKNLTLADELSRLEIRSPLAGFVHQLDTHTIGGVIPAGSTMLQVVPSDDLLIIKAQVEPTDIDQVYVGQESMIRLPSLDQRLTPKLSATIQTVAADQTFDDATQRSYFEVRLAIAEEELAKLKGQKLISGMPVEAFVTTGDRSVLSYLSKPIMDQLAHSMRES